MARLTVVDAEVVQMDDGGQMKHQGICVALAAFGCATFVGCTSDPDATTPNSVAETVTSSVEVTAAPGTGSALPQTSSPDTSGATPESSATPSTVEAGPTDGLDDATIRVGYIGVDFGAMAAAGVAPDLGDQKRTMQAFVDQINETGGIDGRQVELRVEIYDGLADPEVGQAACIEIAQSFDPFVVILGSAVDPEVARCVSVVNERLTIGNVFGPGSLYEEANGLLWDLGVSQTRFLRSWAADLEAQGFLDGKVGVVSSEGPRQSEVVESDLIPALTSLGHEPVASVVLPCPEGDSDCDQHEAAIQRLKDAGAERVLVQVAPLANSPLLEAARNLGYEPMWSFAGDATTDTVAAFYAGSADLLDGSVGLVSFVPEGDPPSVVVECNEVAAAAGAEYEPDSDAYGFTGSNCQMLLLFQQAVESVEGEVGQTSVSHALGEIGEIPATAGLFGSWAADKRDAANYGARVVFDATSGLWVPSADEPVLFAG